MFLLFLKFSCSNFSLIGTKYYNFVPIKKPATNFIQHGQYWGEQTQL